MASSSPSYSSRTSSHARRSSRRSALRHRANANFAAALARRENLAGIEQPRRIERVAHPAHQRQIRLAKQQRHQPILFHSHAVLASDCAAHLDAETDNCVGRRNRALELFRLARVEKNNRVQVAVARMKNISDLETIFFSDALNF